MEEIVVNEILTDMFLGQEIRTPPSTPPPSLEYTSEDYDIDDDTLDIFTDNYYRTLGMVVFLESLPAPELPTADVLAAPTSQGHSAKREEVTGSSDHSKNSSPNDADNFLPS